MAFHRSLRGDDLHPSKIDFYEGSPIGNVTPEYIGQPIIDTVNKSYYSATGLTVDDWELIGAPGGGVVLSSASDVDSTGRSDGDVLEWNETTQQHEYVADIQAKSAGIIGPEPAIVDNGDGSVTIPTADVVLYENPDNQGKSSRYTVPSVTITLTDGVTTYIVVDYNGGTPIYKGITNVDLINESNVVPVSTMYRNNTDIYRISWDSLADGMSNKLHMRFVKTDRFGWEYGIALAEEGIRTVTTTAGKVWYGAVRTDIPAFNSASDEWSFWYHVAGEWVEDKTTTQYNNLQYDDGTNLVTANNNEYIVNWIFRCSCDPAIGAYVLGDTDYASVAEAKNATLPDIPSILSSVHFLVGRIIVEKNADSGIVETAFARDIVSTGVIQHNDLAGLNNGDYQHLTQVEYDKLYNLDGRPIIPIAKYHRNQDLTFATINTWYDLPWDLDIADETTFGFTRDGATVTVDGFTEGILNINGAIRPEWIGITSSTDTVNIYVRVIQSSDGGTTWTEARCIQSQGVRTQKTGSVSTTRFGGTIYVQQGDIFKTQIQVDNTDLILSGSAVFDNSVAATIFIEYASRTV